MYDKSNCSMITYIRNTPYCDYYDAGCMPCSKNKNCPEEDEDEDVDYEQDFEEY